MEFVGGLGDLEEKNFHRCSKMIPVPQFAKNLVVLLGVEKLSGKGRRQQNRSECVPDVDMITPSGVPDVDMICIRWRQFSRPVYRTIFRFFQLTELMRTWDLHHCSAGSA